MSSVKIAPLSSFLNIEMGQSPEAEFVNQNNIGVPLLNGPAEFTEKYPIPVQYTTNGKRFAEKYDILFCVRGSTTGRMNIANQRYAIGRGLAAISHKNGKHLNSFVKGLIESNLSSLLGGTLGSVFPNLTKDQLFGFRCSIPDLTTQQKVAAVLSALDDKIELNNKINAELEAMAKTLYDYWFVQFDFPDEHGKPYKSSGGKMEYNETLKREIPEGWEVKSLGDICIVNKKQLNNTHSLNYINYLDTSNITRNSIAEITLLTDLDDIPSRARRIVKKNDIIYSTVRPNQEHYGILKNPVENMVVSTGFAVISHKSNSVYNDLIYAFLSNPATTLYLQNIAETSVSAYPSINVGDILNMFIPLPPDDSEVIISISKSLSSINELVDKNQKQNKELANLRDWLLPMLMNGQVQVWDADERAATNPAQPKRRKEAPVNSAQLEMLF